MQSFTFRQRRTFIQAAGAMVATAVCPGWAGSSSVQPLVIWFTVEGAKAIREIALDFTAATGVPVVVETPDNGPTKFQQAASAGKGPDIYFYTHDRLGEWTAGGLLHAVSPGPSLLEDLDALAWKGFTYRNRVWGYPYAIEAVTLIHNKALVPTAPQTFEEVFALDAQLAPKGKRAILWDYTNAYFSWPLLGAHGGFAFAQRPDGSYDPRSTGVNNAGSVLGASLIDRMVREGLMQSGSGYAEMEAAMAQGKVAMMINGPWSWVNLRKVGIDFGIARIPAVSGKAAAPYVGVKGVMINRATRQRELAVEFIENYLLKPKGLRTMDRAEPIGAPASKTYYAELSKDPRIAGIMASAKDGTPSPSIPEMGRFWAAMKSSLTTLSEGRLSPQEAMNAAARRILGT